MGKKPRNHVGVGNLLEGKSNSCSLATSPMRGLLVKYGRTFPTWYLNMCTQLGNGIHSN